MADTEGTGRARGRSRGRAPGDPAGELGGEEREGSPTNGRGRGGYRALRTIPQGISVTAGSGGTQVSLLSNYLRLETPSNMSVHDYRVDFEPNVEAVVVRRGMITDHKDKFGNAYIFDGMHNLKTLTKLDGDPFIINATRKTDGAPITIKLTYSGPVPWGAQEMLRLYNTQVRRNMSHLKYILIGRNFFDPRKKIDLGEFNLSIWPGLATAVNVHDGGTLLVCDTVHKVVRNETAYDVLKAISRRGDNLQRDAPKELAGAIVLTSYNNKTYRIDDIVTDKNPSSTFEKKGVSISFVDYYKQQYNITIRDPDQPLLQVMPDARQRRGGDAQPILLIPELCFLTGLSAAHKANYDLKKTLTQRTQAVPNERIKHLLGFRNALVSNADVRREMDIWGLSIAPGIVEFPGRQIDNESIYMEGGAEIKWTQQSGDFSKEIRGKGMLRGLKLEKWCIIVSSRDKNQVEDFSQNLRRVSDPLKFILHRPQIIELDSDRTGAYIDGCNRAVAGGFQLAVVIVPNNNKDRYDAIKKVFCCDKPMASQVIIGRTLAKKQMLMSVCTKVGIQMAVKLGAEAWGLKIPPKRLMVVGYDTHHDGLRRGASVGGFVCSINDTLTRYYSRVAYHHSHTEMSDNFASNFIEGLNFYRKTNGQLPERIVIYRDGVSEGQIPHVYDVELQNIKNGIRRVAGETPIRLSFVIVTKRVNSRFFLRTGERNAENPKCGTIIDTVITRKDRYDFYLISQAVRAGTVAPTNFNIIEDESGWKPQHHQQLAYKLTHLYYNWMGTIRVPAPCQYAHKLAFLTGTSLHKEPNPQLADTLFYL